MCVAPRPRAGAFVRVCLSSVCRGRGWCVLTREEFVARALRSKPRGKYYASPSQNRRPTTSFRGVFKREKSAGGGSTFGPEQSRRRGTHLTGAAWRFAGLVHARSCASSAEEPDRAAATAPSSLELTTTTTQFSPPPLLLVHSINNGRRRRRRDHRDRGRC
jgi:hypothetical protein